MIAGKFCSVTACYSSEFAGTEYPAEQPDCCAFVNGQVALLAPSYGEREREEGHAF